MTSSDRVRDREAVNLEQFLYPAPSNPVFVGLARLVTINPYCSGFFSTSAIANEDAAGLPDRPYAIDFPLNAGPLIMVPSGKEPPNTRLGENARD